MTSTSMNNVEHRQTLSKFFYKLLPMTIRSGDRNTRLKKKQSSSTVLPQNDLSSITFKQNEHLLVKSSSSSVPMYEQKQISTTSDNNFASNSNENNMFTYVYYNEQDNYLAQVRT